MKLCWRCIIFVTERHLISTMSNHAPLLFHISNQAYDQKRKKSFRFENMWTRHVGYEVVITDGWTKDRVTNFEGLSKGVQQCGASLSRWNKEVIGNIQHRIKQKEAELEALLCGVTSLEDIGEIDRCKKDLQELTLREEIF